MDAAEDLFNEIKPDQLYPMEFVVYRVTGFRPDSGTFDATVVGQALIRDLGAFIQSLSADLELSMDQPRGRAVSLDELARKLEVDRRTIQRRRGDGLVLHWVQDSSGVPFLGCYPDAIDRYLEKLGGPLRRNRPWKRMTSDERQSIIDRADEIHVAEGCTLDSTAARIAVETCRARSTIRQVLKRHDQTAEHPIFGEHGALNSRDVDLCNRARQMGIPLASCATRFGKSVPAIHRAMLRQRVSRLKSIPLRWSHMQTFDRSDVDEVLLGIQEVHQGLPGPDGIIDLANPQIDEGAEGRDRLVAAAHWLIARAVKALEALPGQPRNADVDVIERDLIWAGRLRAALVRQGLPASLHACEHWLGRPVQALPREPALSLLLDAMQVTSSVVSAMDPGRSNRLESRCTAAMDRELSARDPVSRTRAAARHDTGDLCMPWPLKALVAWPWLEPDPRWLMKYTSLETSDRELVVKRWGLLGYRPHGTGELASAQGRTPSSMQRRLHNLEVQLRMNSTSLETEGL